MARPISTSYTDEEREDIVSHIVAEVSAGRAVSRVLREDVDMPSARQFWTWHFQSEEIQERIALARLNGVEANLEEAKDIADQATSKEDAPAIKVRVETRFKYAQMIAPRKYGAKLDLTSDGKALGVTGELEAARKRIEGVTMLLIEGGNDA